VSLPLGACIIHVVGERAFLSLGSNLEPESNLPRAALGLLSLGRVLAVSEVYRNPAVGPTPGPDFLNAAVLLETAFSPHDLRTELRSLEARLGRLRTADKYAPRLIDIDLVLYGDRVIRDAEWEIPDPELISLPHLVIPLAELDPNHKHPVTGERLSSIASRILPQAQMQLVPDASRRLRMAAGLGKAGEA
jgi:2-amino-4-hydroxy-6-hydroxymethyldihydropteridine diphosphokinase